MPIDRTAARFFQQPKKNIFRVTADINPGGNHYEFESTKIVVQRVHSRPIIFPPSIFDHRRLQALVCQPSPGGNHRSALAVNAEANISLAACVSPVLPKVDVMKSLSCLSPKPHHGHESCPTRSIDILLSE